MKKLKNIEKQRAGEEVKRAFREPLVPPGLPGSGPQMHTEIVTEILKNCRRRHYEQSGSVKLTKHRFKPHEDKPETVNEFENLLDQEQTVKDLPIP